MQRHLTPDMNEADLATALQSTSLARFRTERALITSIIAHRQVVIDNLKRQRALAKQLSKSKEMALNQEQLKKKKKQYPDIIASLTAEKAQNDKVIKDLTQRITNLFQVQTNEHNLLQRVSRMIEREEAHHARVESTKPPIAAHKTAEALPLQNAANNQAVPLATKTDDLPEYTALIKAIDSLKTKQPHDEYFILTAYHLAETYRNDADEANSREVLTAAKAVVENNSPETRDAFLPIITKNTEGKRNYAAIVGGALIMFIGAAMMAAGIAAMASGAGIGVGTLLFISGSLVLAGMGLPLILFGISPTGKAKALQDFHTEASPKRYGIFGNRIKPNYSNIQPETPSPAFN